MKTLSMSNKAKTKKLRNERAPCKHRSARAAMATGSFAIAARVRQYIFRDTQIKYRECQIIRETRRPGYNWPSQRIIILPGQ